MPVANLDYQADIFRDQRISSLEQDRAPRNEILNGAFEIWQRGTSISGVNSTRYVADRWQHNAATATAVITYSRSTDIPTGAQSGWYGGNSILANCTTVDNTGAVGRRYDIGQPIVGYQWARLRDKTVTISFWVKATVTGTYCLSLANNGQDRSYVAEYQVNASATWERKTITLTLNPTGGTDNYLNGVGLFVRWALAAGTTFQTTPNSWQTGNFTATSNQVNALSTISNQFQLAQVQVSVGTVPTVFVRREGSWEGELAACQAYYEKSYAVDIAPGTAGAAGRVGYLNATASFWANNSRVNVRFAVSKIRTPTCTVYSDGVGTAGRVSNDAAVDRTASLNTSVGTSGVELAYTDATASNGIFFHWVADAEL